MTRVLFALAFVSAASVARAEPCKDDAAEPPVEIASRPAPEAPRNAVYVELLGKGGLYGIGYERTFTSRIGAGATLSLYQIHGQRVLSFSPYLGVYPAGRARHAWFVQIGPQIVDLAIASPVAEWEGEHTTDISAQLSSGYEYRNRVIVRVFLTGVAGAGGVAPWGGVSVGMEL